MSSLPNAAYLVVHGFVVIPTDVNQPTTRKALLASFLKHPEFLSPAPSTYQYDLKTGLTTKPRAFVGGGFSAMGHPSSFHDPVVRSIRAKVMPIVGTVLHESLVYSRSPDDIPLYGLEQLNDRTIIRPIGEQATKECK
jgi:hypothetical protein